MHVYSLWQDLSHGTIIFYLVTFTLKFDLLFKYFYLGCYCIQGKFCPFYYCPFHPLARGRIQNGANWIIYKGLWQEIREWANSRLGELVSDLYRVKIWLGEFKAVILYIYCPVWRETWRFVQPRKFMSPEGDMDFLGWTNLHVSRLTEQLIVYYTES